MARSLATAAKSVNARSRASPAADVTWNRRQFIVRRMRILIAPDKFKGSLGALAVGCHIAAGLRAVWPEAEIQIQPVADGGEGTAEVLRQSLGGVNIQCAAHDARGHAIEACYVWIASARIAVLEMSAAAGLAQLSPNERDPLSASTFGVGEIFRAALARGADNILVGLGGSATNDGGLGLARALGFRFLDPRAKEITSADGLADLARIERPADLVLPAITAVSDVCNPLLGPRGATHTFGPQKGATPEMIVVLERALTRLADVVAETGTDFRAVPGAGAAGGLGFGLLAFCGAELRAGFEVVAEAIGLRRAIAEADYVITGEGQLDRQTLEGKAPAGVARLAREAGKPVFAFVGRADDDPELRALFDGVVSLHNEPPFADNADLLEARAREFAQSWPA